jgi:hypothetical protein
LETETDVAIASSWTRVNAELPKEIAIVISYTASIAPGRSESGLTMSV